MTTEKPSIFNKVASVFVSKTEEPAPVQPVANAKPAATNLFGSPVKPAPVSQFVPDDSRPTFEADPTIQKILEADIQEAARPAYTQFSITEQSMAAAVPDERTRMKAAAAVILAQGHTIDKVLIDVDECLEALDKKEKENSAASAQARERKIGSKQNQLASVNQTIAELRQRLETAENDAVKIQAEIAADEEQIKTTEAKFAATCRAYRQRLLDEKSKIASLAR